MAYYDDSEWILSLKLSRQFNASMEIQMKIRLEMSIWNINYEWFGKKQVGNYIWWEKSYFYT
jgi:hypothetical protein